MKPTGAPDPSPARPDAAGLQHNARAGERGFTLLELFLIMTIIAIVSALAIGLTSKIVRAMKGESVAQQLNGFLRNAREDAVARRRLIRLVHTMPNKLESVEVNPTDGTTKVVRTVMLEGTLEFHHFTDQGDTGDGFGHSSAVTFGGTAPRAFTSEGMFVDASGDPVNGTFFIAEKAFPSTAAAVTIRGAAAAINVWKWNGKDWVQ